MSLSEQRRPRILVIAMANSIHTARWLSQFHEKNIDIILFPSTPSRKLHPLITELLDGSDEMTLQIAPLMKRMAFPLGVLDLFFANNLRSLLLKKLILGRHKFNVIHSLELQHAGYLLLKASSAIPELTRVIISNWGSDIFWFQRFPRHRKKLESLMKIATHYSCECKRDVSLAHNLGFTGINFPVHPNAGVFSEATFLAAEKAPPPSSRRTIMIKGYTGFVGRADLALEACRIAAETIKGFEIILYSSDVKSRRIARQLSIEKGLNITMFRKHELGHEQMLDFFRNSRIYIGISESDGISTSLLDAISSGCYPIQTNTSCANEWVADGVTGSLVDLHDIHGISAAIENAIKNDHLVDAASHLNIKTARTRLSSESIGQDIHQFYELF